MIVFVVMEFIQLPLGMLFENKLNLKLNYEEHYIPEFTWYR
jgi:hypothetical protein